MRRPGNHPKIAAMARTDAAPDRPRTIGSAGDFMASVIDPVASEIPALVPWY